LYLLDFRIPAEGQNPKESSGSESDILTTIDGMAISGGGFIT
jgi:hypothetical protein